MSRDRQLEERIEGPPASPIVEYPSEQERRRVIDALGFQESFNRSTLDIASEVGVARELSPGSITRVDFSENASERAASILGERIERYERTTPAGPELPEGDFDGAISVGPYGWKFLDTDALTGETANALTADGRFVLTVPTTRSPAARSHWRENRYYDPEAARGLLEPAWKNVDTTPIFQYPYYLHRLIGSLPERAQEPFVSLAGGLSGVLDVLGTDGLAASLVVSGSPIPYGDWLDSALDALFRPTDEDGFWDPEEGKIVRALEYRKRPIGLTWSVDDRVLWRYGPMALLGAMSWRAAVGDDRYDAKLEHELEYFAERAGNTITREEMPSDGLGALVRSFVLASDIFDDGEYRDLAWTLFEHTDEHVEFTHAEDALVLYGWASLHERLTDTGVRNGSADAGFERAATLRGAITDALDRINDHLTEEGVFEFENRTTRHHPDQMYALWGVCRAVATTGLSGYLDVAERVLDYAIGERMRADGAFRRQDVGLQQRLRRGVRNRLDFEPSHRDLLFSSHQSLFVASVAEYYRAGGEKEYDEEVARAMAWIDGENTLGESLVEESDIGVPMRHLGVDGGMDVPGQRFVGAYEVGAFVMALSALSDWPSSS